MEYRKREPGTERREQKEVRRVYMAGLSEASERRKEKGEINEDVFFLDEKIESAGICDGVGGHPDGEIAAAVAARALQKYLRENFCVDIDTGLLVMEKAFLSAHAEVYKAGLKRPANQNGKRMETTAVVVKVIEETERDVAIIGWVGDSRAHHYRGDVGKMEIVTLDDAHWVQKMKNHDLDAPKVQHILAQAEQPKSLAEYPVADPEKKYYPFSLTQALGGSSTKTGEKGDITVNVTSVVLKKGDKILLTGDGVHDVVPLNRMMAIIEMCDEKEAARELVEEAKRRVAEKSPRGHDDDKTAVLIGRR